MFLRRGTVLLIASLVLHPTHKLKYFQKKGWDKEWISTAEEIVREEFKRNYAVYVIHKGKKASCSSKKVCLVFFILNTTYRILRIVYLLAQS